MIYAIIEIGDRESTQAGLESSHGNVRRGASIALDQMPGGKLDPKQVVAELGATDGRMQDAAWWIVSRHSQEWGGLLADRLRMRLAEKQTTPEQRRAEDAIGPAGDAPVCRTGSWRN